MLTKLCWDASSISRVCICLDKSLISIWAAWRASVFCETCTCTSAIWCRDREKGVSQEKILPVNVFINEFPLLGLNLPDFHANVWGPLHSSKPSSHSWPSLPPWSGTGPDLWERQHPLARLTGRSDSSAPSPPIWQKKSKKKPPKHSGCVTFDSCCKTVTCDDWLRNTVNLHFRGSSSGSWAPPSRLQSHSRCSSWSCWCHLWLSSARRCRPPQTGGLPAHCQTWRNARTQTDWEKCYICKIAVADIFFYQIMSTACTEETVHGQSLELLTQNKSAFVRDVDELLWCASFILDQYIKRHKWIWNYTSNNLLYFEVVSSKTGVVDLEDETSVLCNLVVDLGKKRKKREILWQVEELIDRFFFS